MTAQKEPHLKPPFVEDYRGPRRRIALAAAVAIAGVVFWAVRPVAAETARLLPEPASDVSARSGEATEVAVLAGGCFWGMQGVFQHVRGVTSAVSGYAGGDPSTARYDLVGSGTTGHAESVRIIFDPRVISYGRLLQIYFSVAHDPTQLNRQGPDIGTQYRSTVFALDADQARVARSYIQQLDTYGTFDTPITTTIEALRAFHSAEAYHQDFMLLHPNHPYIVTNDLPKIENLRRLFPASYRAQALRSTQPRAM
jgi:peptide-methionine (S)-S-oxide reductase